MFSRLVFLLVLAQTCFIAYGFMAEDGKTILHFLVYGSPVYLIAHVLSGESIFQEGNKAIVALALFHAVKYLSIAKAQFTEDREWTLTAAILMEAGYLAYSAYRML